MRFGSSRGHYSQGDLGPNVVSGEIMSNGVRLSRGGHVEKETQPCKKSSGFTRLASWGIGGIG